MTGLPHIYLLFYREKRCASRMDMLPWICIGLQTLEDSNSFLPFEVLMDASHGMLEHYKERLATKESENHLEWSQKGVLCLVRRTAGFIPHLTVTTFLCKFTLLIRPLNSANVHSQGKKKVKSAYEPGGPSGRRLSPVSVA